MAFKILASKAEHDALPEAVRAHYVERDGRFYPDVEGGLIPAAEALDLKTKLAEFRDNNRTMHSELETLRPLKTRFEGIDPDEVRRNKTELETLRSKGVKEGGDLTALVAAAVEQATKPLKDALTLEARKREEAEAQTLKATFKDLVTAECNKGHIKGSALKHALREAETVFEVKDGRLVPKTGVKHPSDPLKEMTPSDWLTELAKTDSYLFEENGGGGSQHGNNLPGGGAGVKRLINPTALEMGTHADAIAKGEMVVVRT